MKSRIITCLAIVTTVSAIILPTASAGQSKLARWCPQSQGVCQESGTLSRSEPRQFRPMIIPLRAKDQHGQEVWRSGSWIMY